MTTLLGKIKLLRTTSSAIADVVLEEGRVVYLTDTNSFVSGDGVNVGADLPSAGPLFNDSSPTLSTDLNLNAHNITTLENSGIAIGYNCLASGNGSIAMGYQAFALGANSVALGGVVTAAGTSSLVTGMITGSTENGFGSLVSGTFNSADSVGSLVTGCYSQSHLPYSRVFSSLGYGTFLPLVGSTQAFDCAMGCEAASGVPKNLSFSSLSESKFTVPSGRAIFGTATIAGISQKGSEGCMFVRRFGIKNVSGETTLIGTPQTIGTDIKDQAHYSVDISADNTDEALIITASGNTSMRWLAYIQGVDTKFKT